MSRDIKFRLHCAETGQILAYEKFNTTLNWGYYWYDATLPEDDQICQTLDYFKHPHPLGKVVRVEFTGLKDKNGVDIYEGDIVSVPGHGNCEVNICPYYGVTYTGSDGYAAPHADCAAEMDYPTIIGNIHQHPELLK